MPTPRICEVIRAGFGGELREMEPLALHTSLRVGGPADLFAVPRNRDELLYLLKTLRHQQLPWFIIGGGYNLLVRDGGFRGVVISLKQLNRMQANQNGTITAESGVRNIDLSRLAEAHCLTGLEFLVGIPGTLGGAVRMNAGANGGEIFDHLTSVDILVDETIQQFDKKSLDYGYRRLQLDANKIIISANFQLEAGDRDIISVGMNACLQKRRENQKVTYPNAGSFFKNPPGQAAWSLIDRAGLRGWTVGGAQVSEVHTNFLVNKGTATAADFLELATHIKGTVYKNSGIHLEEEVRIVGED